MQYITKLKLASVHQYCDVEEKSTEYMFQFMQDSCKVDLDTCVAYMELGDDEHTKLFKEINSLLDLIIHIENLQTT